MESPDDYLAFSQGITPWGWVVVVQADGGTLERAIDQRALPLETSFIRQSIAGGLVIILLGGVIGTITISITRKQVAGTGMPLPTSTASSMTIDAWPW